MIKDSYKNLFDVVLVWKLDRFARNRYDSAYYKNILKKNGVRLVSIKESISQGADGILLEAILDGFVNSIYLYDDRFVITFNYKGRSKTVSFEELNSSSLTSKGSPVKTLSELISERVFSLLFTLAASNRVRNRSRNHLRLKIGNYARFGSKGKR